MVFREVEHLYLQAAYFRNKIDDLILFVFISATRIEPRNVGKVTEQGFETSIVLRPLSYIEILGSYTFLDGELEDTGAQLPGNGKSKASLTSKLFNRFLISNVKKILFHSALTPTSYVVLGSVDLELGNGVTGILST